MRVRFILPALTLLVPLGCSSGQKSSPDGASGQSSSSAGSGGAGVSGGAGAMASGGGQAMAGSGGSAPAGPVFAGADCPEDLGFSSVLALANVQGSVDGTNVRITFDPLGAARDYRVYVLPEAGAISGDSVQGATYRCAGGYAVPFPAIDDSETPENPGIRTRVASMVYGYERSDAEATLGYVFTTPAVDRLPVYALGAPDLKADNADCYFMRWPESRVKKYTTSESEREQLLDEHWRDDGVVFYVPKPEATGVAPVYEVTGGQDNYTYYVTAGAEHDLRVEAKLDVAEVFTVHAEPQPGSEPLMRVFYQQACARNHDELVPGEARFNKAFRQGASPVAELHFSGVTAETTLVVEALDELCPHQGVVAPSSRPARTDVVGDFTIDYPAFQTPDELRAASETGEVFINGQGLEGAPSKALARACLKVTPPREQPEMDWRYDGSPQTFSAEEQKGFQIWETESDTFNVQFHTVATDEWSIGGLFGELWATYGDWAADTNGKLRITPKARATLANDSYVHATMEVDMVSTQRRYPQLLISDQEWPVQDNLVNGSTVLIQTFGGITIPIRGEIQFCDHRTWDVNNQCPMFELYKLGPEGEQFLSPQVEINGLSGVDRTVRFDAYVSTQRAYLFTNGKPYACAELPADRLTAGSATVTFGDVLYHSGVDLEAWYPYHLAKMHNVTSRHFSNLAFASGRAAPTWDETRHPCAPASALRAQ